ncbi:MAG: class I SAM-dependent methyltransferase [Candidatus Methanomethylicota archaeon]|nr:MAG: class I SAM-dependent methyltransferase [Candidatus Verstraetearchaeota archaeon]
MMSTHKIFDKLWKKYDAWYYKHSTIFQLEYSALKSLIKSKPILEVGVGTGFFAQKLGFDFGLDPSINMLIQAKRRGICVVRGVGENLPFRSNSFGCIVFIVTLCFVDDVISVLNEAYRVLYNGGEIVACIIPENSNWGKYYKKLGREGNPFYSHAHFLHTDELKLYLSKSGFKIVDCIGVLSFNPGEKAKFEKPSRDISNKGFVCIKALK